MGSRRILKHGLTLRENSFLKHYLAPGDTFGNGSQAILATTPKVTLESAGVSAARMPGKARVQDAIKEGLEPKGLSINRCVDILAEVLDKGELPLRALYASKIINLHLKIDTSPKYSQSIRVTVDLKGEPLEVRRYFVLHGHMPSIGERELLLSPGPQDIVVSGSSESVQATTRLECTAK